MPVQKRFRQGQILKLLAGQAVASQDELRRRLGHLGLRVTQATLSRDLRELRLVKTTEGDQTEKFSAADALPALMDAVRGMRVGEKCRIWLPPDKAYGLTGKPPVIGPNEAIEYEFELVNAE